MNNIKKLKSVKETENGDISYNTTGNDIVDIFFMTPYFEKNLDEVKIGKSEKEKIFSMYVRDPRLGLGRRDLGRKLLELSEVNGADVVKAGRYDDLLAIASDECIEEFIKQLNAGNELAKKWSPRLKGKNKQIAKELCNIMGITEKEYRKLIKSDTTEYKLSYCEKKRKVPTLSELINKDIYKHPLLETIEFDKVPSLAMAKYLNTFTNKEELKDRFSEYVNKVKEGKQKVNTATTTVYDALKMSSKNNMYADILSKKIVDEKVKGIEMNCLVILDSSGSMYDSNDSIGKATSVAHALSISSTFSPNQLIAFSNEPELIDIKGETLQDQYSSMRTKEVAYTDFGKVMKLCTKLKKYPEYFVCLSDMEFDCGSTGDKEKSMKIIKEKSPDTKIIWWNFNARNKTVPEMDEYGNIFLSGYNIQLLKLLENKFDINKFIDSILVNYTKELNKV